MHCSIVVVHVAAALVAIATTRTHAQQTTNVAPPQVATIQQLFDAMRTGDTARARALFVPVGRVIPLRGTGAPLNVDQFVAYVATLPVGSWTERIWDPHVDTFGDLGQVWFEYDVVRADTVRQCGRQSVQLSRTTAGWRIVSMAFLTSLDSCVRSPG